MKDMFLGVAFLSVLGVANNANATTELIDKDNAHPPLSRSTFVMGEEIELPVGVLQGWLKSTLEKPSMITQTIDGYSFHVTIKGFEKKQEVENFLKKSPQETALFKPFKGRTTLKVGSWVHGENWELWFYVGEQYFLENSFS